MPALLTRTSTPPHAEATSATPRFTCSSLVTSMATPRPLISSAAACAWALLRSAMATRAPSWAKRTAMALPMPLAAPVTRQTLFRSFMLGPQQIEHAHAMQVGLALGPARIGERLQHVRAAARPVLEHGVA